MAQTTFRRMALASIVSVLLAAPSGALAQSTTSMTHWTRVPDEVLARLRGGLDIGGLSGYFAIERVVRVDGVDVARTLLVINNLGNLTQGRLPDVQVLGNLANAIQIGTGNAAPGASAAQQAAAIAAAATNAAMAQADAAMRNAQAAAAQANPLNVGGGPSGGAASSAANGNSAVNASSNMASSSLAQFGAGLEQAVAVATGEGRSIAPAPAAATTVSGNPAPATPPAAATAVAPAPPQVATTGTMVIPIGNTGQVIVVSNIPQAAALSTAIQNSVAATQIQAETRINASLVNSLSALRSGAFAAAIRDQAIQSLRP